MGNPTGPSTGRQPQNTQELEVYVQGQIDALQIIFSTLIEEIDKYDHLRAAMQSRTKMQAALVRNDRARGKATAPENFDRGRLSVLDNFFYLLEP